MKRDWLVDTIFYGILVVFTVAVLGLVSTAFASTCQFTKDDAISMVPKDAIAMQANDYAFAQIYERYNRQRQSLGHGHTEADELIVVLFKDTSVALWMSLKGCYIKGTDARMTWPKFRVVMEELGLSPYDFVPPKESGVDL